MATQGTSERLGFRYLLTNVEEEDQNAALQISSGGMPLTQAKDVDTLLTSCP